MKFVISGGNGFLGSNLAKALIAENMNVSVFIGPSGKTDRIKGLPGPLNIFPINNLKDRDYIDILKDTNVVIHTAASFGRKGESPVSLYKTNIEWPLILLTHSLNLGINTFINIDTSIPKYTTLYSITKKHFSEIGRYFTENYTKFNFINMVMEHLYGPGDGTDKFTTWLIRQCLLNSPKIELTKGEQKRDFIYITDAVAALVKTILYFLDNKYGSYGFKNIGIGSGHSISIKNFAESVHTLTQSSGKIFYGGKEYRNHEIMDSNPDLAFIKSIGWSPVVDLHCGLIQTIAFEKLLLNNTDVK